MELATVKKGTPLYGQPSWWGEADDEDKQGDAPASKSKKPGDKKDAGKRSRPSSLGLSPEETAATASSTNNNNSSSSATTTTAAAAKSAGMAKHYAGPTYMEIPLKDDDSPTGADKSGRDNVTPAKSVSSSLSKDSLLFSPETKQQTSSKSAKEHSPTVEVNPATSFTIDLDDPEHPPKKSLNSGRSLSEFVPPKIRKNFQDRKAVVSKGGSKESTPSKNSEERELSPLSSRKIDEIWSQVVEKKGQAAKLSSTHATIGSAASLRSPNLEGIDKLSEFEERRSQEREADRKAKRVAASKSPLSSAKAKTLSASQSGQPSAGGANLAQYSDTASYLFEKMFEGGSSVASSHGAKEMSPEQKLYKEAASHDKPLAGRRSMEKPVARPAVTATPPKKVSDSKTAVGAKTSQKAVKKTPVKSLDGDDEDNDNGDDDLDLEIREDDADSIGDEKTKDDKEDKASEAGTYTIEADSKEGEEEEEEARKKIDQVFGVDLDNFTSDQPHIDPLRLSSPGGYDNVYDNDGDKTPLDENGQSPSDYDLTLDDDVDDLDADDVADLEFDENDKDYEENADMAAPDGVQTWVSQLAALTNQKSSGMSADGSKQAKDDDPSLTKKPPQGLSRKRPGTGRKLPSIPTDRSPVSSEHSSYVGDHDLTFGEDVASGHTPDLTLTGKNLGSSNGKSGTISSSQRRSSRHSDINNGYVDSASQNGVSAASPATSARSRGSVDTELLLQDTETLMSAMEKRMANKNSRDKRSSRSTDSDTDVSSTVALVNGDDSYVKPTLYKSPRDALAKRQQKDVPAGKHSGNHTSTPATTQGKKPVGRSYSQTLASKASSLASPRSMTSVTGVTSAKKSLVSDVLSRRDSMDNDSVISDVSSDTGDGNLSRSSSKGKGPLSMTKPNRAFQLRRARADSFDEPTTPRSAKSSASSRSGTSTARSSSVHSTTRTRSMIETHRSEATSLGGQIVRKSRANESQDKNHRTNSSNNLTRGERGRNSQGGLQRASSLTISQPQPASVPSKREPTPKSHLRSTPTGHRGNLSITGVSSGVSSRSQSQPGSRSNSPKAAERMAWKRRKEYDPRRAVAEAKAKAKDPSVPVSTAGVKMRPKPSASSNYKRRMIRSASFTNPAELSLSDSLSTSTSQDFGLSDRRTGYEHEGFRRAFMPVNSLRTDRSVHSADEDDSLVSANSTQTSNATICHDASYDSLIVTSIYQLSLKLKTATDKSLNKLREQDRVSLTPSPTDDFLSDSGKSEIPAWKSANQELAGILKNLRKTERHFQMINSVLFPEDDINTVVSSGVPTNRQGKQRYVQEIERIRSELAGFHPIDHPRPDESEVPSPEMAELGEQF